MNNDDDKYYCRYCGEQVEPPTEIMGVSFDIAVNDPRISFKLACIECQKDRKNNMLRFDACSCNRSEQ